VFGIAYCVGAAAGEELNDVPRLRQIDARDARETPLDVYLNDSFAASDAIAKATRLADAQRWREAAELLQRTLASAGDKLVRVSPGYYAGVRGFITDIICAWPEDGVAAYRALYEREMLSALDEVSTSRSVEELLALFNRYFCTAAGGKLADTIGQLAIEAGDLALAKRVYQRVVDHHPDRSEYISRYQAMLALLAVMGGDTPGDTPSTGKDVKIRWKGTDRTLGDVLEEVREAFTALRQPAPHSEQWHTTDWPVFGGSRERNRRSPSTVDEIGLLWRSDVFKPPVEEEAFDDSFRTDADQGRRLSIQPVISRELVFVQRYREVAAIHRNTGVVAWRFRGDRTRRNAYDDLDEQPPSWDSVSIHDGRVYVVLPGDIVPFYGYESPQSPPELVCLQADTGRVIWRSDREKLAQQPSELSFDSSPIVDHGRLYVVGRRRRSFGFEDCYLYCLDAANGQSLFRTHLGSASTGTFGSRRPTLAMVSLHGDTAYVCTNLGSVAAVSAYTGAVRWLRLYERNVDDLSRESGSHGSAVNTWAFNPLFLAGERLVCLPMDSASVLVLAAHDGCLLHAIPVDEFGETETLFGVEGNVLCGGGEEIGCYDLAEGALTWSEHLGEDEGPFGRGTWAGDHLYVPTKRGVSSFRVSDGWSSEVEWEAGGSGGNLVALPDQLFVAGRDFVAVYVRKTELWNALRERMAANPSAPLPALELAEVALRGGEFDEALEVLDEAVRRAGEFAEPIEPLLQRRFFDDILMFVEVLAARALLEAPTLERLFTFAAQCPPDADAHLQYRFRFAQLYEKHERPERALRLYQQVLRDRSLRELRIDPQWHRISTGGAAGFSSRGTPDSAIPGSEAAKDAARARIASLIDRHGVSIYEPYGVEARRWYQTGQASGDLRLLARVVETFPNSNAAPLALIAHGELLAKMNHPHEAARLLARAYHRYPKHVNRPGLIRKIADAYGQAGKPEHAYRWLTKAAREHPGATTDYRGRQIIFLEYRKRVADVRAKVEPARPDIVLPLDQPFVRELDGAVSLLTPRFGNDPACRWSRYFVSTDQGIRVFDTRTNAEVWAQPLTVRTTAELLIATGESAVFATQHEVFAVDVSTGVRRWLHGRDPELIDGHLGDWEEGDRYRTHAFLGDRLVSVRDDGEMSCVNVGTGELIWSQTRHPVPVGPVRIGDLWIVYHVVQDEQAVVCRVDAVDGGLIDATSTHDHHPLVDLFMALDGQAVVATTRSLAAYDLEAGERRWQVRLHGPPRPGSLLMDIDAFYLSDDGRQLRKFSLEDGRVLWESEQLTRRGAEDLAVGRQDGSLIVSTSSSVSAVDEVTGLTLWRGTAPESARFVERLATRAYIVAVDIPDEFGEPECVAYFYDHRNASGLIPRVGGALKLGALPDLRTLMAGDGALLVQSGSKILGWTNK
jgi:outer membrane protein assembly factor BamB/TolA-binding protein